MIVLTLTEQQGQDLAVILDLALKVSGLKIVRQVSTLAEMLQSSFDQIEKDKKDDQIEKDKKDDQIEKDKKETKSSTSVAGGV